MTTAATRLAALLGSPVAHSISPEIHSAAARACGVDLAYVAVDVPAAGFAAAVHGLGALGGLGANVTVPHKIAALELADEVTDEARSVGAANTLWWSGGRLHADNTDARGLGEVLAELDVRGVVVFGAGGAARAAAVALGRRGAAVEVVARRTDAARSIASVVTAAGGVVQAITSPTLLVNATPLGLGGETLPEELMALARQGCDVLDLTYGPVPTPVIAAARRAGARGLDGRGMLVAQAALSFERWTGVAPPRGALAEAAARALDLKSEAASAEIQQR